MRVTIPDIQEAYLLDDAEAMRRRLKADRVRQAFKSAILIREERDLWLRPECQELPKDASQRSFRPIRTVINQLRQLIP